MISFFPFRLACRCAKETSAKGHSHFGLQFYGECWSEAQAADRFDRYGKSRASRCIGFEFKKCDGKDDKECVGGPNRNYVYKILSEGKRK